jgi:hypothetical protein
MFSPGEIWSMIGGSAVVVFGAGSLVEKIRNGKYVAKDTCVLKHENEAGRLRRIEEDVKFIKNWVNGQTGGVA